MKYSTQIFAKLIHYLPGLIILAVAVFALQGANTIIRNHETYIQSYSTFGRDLVEMQETLTDMELLYQQFFRDQSQKNYDALREYYYTAQQRYAKITQDYAETKISRSESFVKMRDIEQRLKNIGNAIDGAEKNYQSILGDIKEEKSLHTQIDLAIDDISHAHKFFFDRMDQTLEEGDFLDSARYLFWSIVVMALCGFSLATLSSWRFQRIQKNDQDIKKNLMLLRDRQMALDSSRDGLMLIDAQGVLTYVNPAFLQIHGMDTEKAVSVLGKIWHSIYVEEDQHKIRYEVLPAIESQGYWRGRFINSLASGEKIYTELSLTKLMDGGLIGSTLDITQEQKAREEKSRMEDQFYQAQKMEAIGRLTGGIAHDFNNILAAMNGYAEFLIEDLPPDSVSKKFAENILAAGRQARDLVDRMLAFSRRSDTSVQALDMIDSVQETAEMLKASLPKSIDLNVKMNAPQAVIRANQTQIAQTIMNLCVNAKDAMEDDRGTLALEVDLVKAESCGIADVITNEPLDPRESLPIRIDDLSDTRTRLVLGLLQAGVDYVRLSVSDTGSGMSRIIMERIFEPFFTTKTVDKGTGLGLATVHGVMSGHQGILVVDSIIGKGTRFDLYFPSIGETKAEEKPKDIIVQAAPVQSIRDEEKRKVLLVEDHENVQDMMKNMLLRIGFDVVVASNGLDALDLIREQPEGFSLVVTDHNMPRMTGLELVQQVYIDLPDLPFILVSGYSQREIQDIQESHPAIRAVLRKPVARDVLEQRIRHILEQSGRSAAA